ncbi:MAG: DUF4254 domain-containing protein [Candidatus Kaelpia imicola]|nr:DUF4254 domain-containing protein [Candidatus Kaelpia imicola]
MAETLGSLLDKLTIKAIRGVHLKKMLDGKSVKFPKSELKKKLQILKEQKVSLLKEIDEFIEGVLVGRIKVLRDEKLKLYNDPNLIGRVSNINSISKAMDVLVKKNLELWNLEDEARREDVPLSSIGSIKKKIDVVNQQRCDLIDDIDELFSQKLKLLREK